MSFACFSKNGKILPSSEAGIPISNIEYAYGYGVYENIRVRKGVPFFIADHIERLMTSANAIGLEHSFKEQDIVQYCLELIKKIEAEGQTQTPSTAVEGEGGGFASCNLKILLIGAQYPKDAQLFIIPLAPLFPDKKLYSNGAKVISVNLERLFPNAKTLNMLPSYLAYKKAKEQGCYDALLVNRDGNITEGTRTNFFVVKGKTIIGAPENEILCGVTRKYVLQVAEENGFEVIEANIPLGKIGVYDGAFLTSTSSKIVPLKQVDNFTYPVISSEIKRLIKLFDEFLDSITSV